MTSTFWCSARVDAHHLYLSASDYYRRASIWTYHYHWASCYVFAKQSSHEFAFMRQSKTTCGPPQPPPLSTHVFRIYVGRDPKIEYQTGQGASGLKMLSNRHHRYTALARGSFVKCSNRLCGWRTFNAAVAADGMSAGEHWKHKFISRHVARL